MRIIIWASVISIVGLVLPLISIIISLVGNNLFTTALQIVLFCVMGIALLALLAGVFFYEKLAVTKIIYEPGETRDKLVISNLFGTKTYRGPFYYEAFIQTKNTDNRVRHFSKVKASFRVDIRLSASKRITLLENIPKGTKLPDQRQIEARLLWEPDFKSTKKFPGHLWDLYKTLK